MKTPYLVQLDRMMLRNNPDSGYFAHYKLQVALRNFLRPSIKQLNKVLDYLVLKLN